jgi:hypothetical protein
VYAVQHGDLYVHGGYPYWFELFPTSRASSDGEDAVGDRRDSGRTQTADSRTAPPAERETLLTRLAAWRDDPTPGVSVLLVHGSGELGGARLAAWFVAESVDREWTAWSAHHAGEPPPQQVVVPIDTGPAAVTVVEHAEQWPADDLQLLLQSPTLRCARRIRVLLVSDSMPGWWPALRHRLGKIGIADCGTVAL